MFASSMTAVGKAMAGYYSAKRFGVGSKEEGPMEGAPRIGPWGTPLIRQPDSATEPFQLFNRTGQKGMG